MALVIVSNHPALPTLGVSPKASTAIMTSTELPYPLSQSLSSLCMEGKFSKSVAFFTCCFSILWCMQNNRKLESLILLDLTRSHISIKCKPGKIQKKTETNIYFTSWSSLNSCAWGPRGPGGPPGRCPGGRWCTGWWTCPACYPRTRSSCSYSRTKDNKLSNAIYFWSPCFKYLHVYRRCLKWFSSLSDCFVYMRNCRKWNFHLRKLSSLVLKIIAVDYWIFGF